MINLKNITLIGAVATMAVLLSACGSYNTTTTGTNPSSGQSASGAASATADASAAVITYTDNGFSPATMNAKVGQKVVFKNNSSSAIQVNSAPHPVHNLYPELNIGAIAAGSTGSTSFAKAGTYKYHNHLNPSQTGTIVVQ